jgi:D-lactate dehydrogenase
MRITMFSSKPYDHGFFDAHNQGHEIRYVEPHLSEQTVDLARGAEVVCCFVNDQLNAKVLSGLCNLGVRLVALRCAGYNNVDLPAAKRLGLPVCRVPEYSPYAVAEHAVGLILALNRNIHRAHNRIRENDYSLNGLMGFDLHGKTVGVVGVGKIGRVFIDIMVGFGCQVLVYDLVENPDVASRARYVTLPELWSRSDILSLHCPLTPATRHLINDSVVDALKPGVMLINTSRGELVDTLAVIRGLKSGRIGYLGLDVYEEEADLFFEDLSNQVMQDDVFARLTTFSNVIVTGHQAFFTREALEKIAEVTLANINAFAGGRVDAMTLVT